MISYAAERDAAIDAALAAGAIHRRWLASGTLGVATKRDGTPVTSSDVEANEQIVRALARRFPADAIVAEESSDGAAGVADNARVWLVDPLDGTRDFIAGTGEFAVHVALVVEGAPVVAAVYQPIADRLFHATAGGGAFERAGSGDRPLSVSAGTSTLRIGVTRFGANDRLRRLRAESDLAPCLVELGASLKLVGVAAGTLDASLALTDVEREWDTCAPELLIREAGGTITDLDGNALSYNQHDGRRTRGLLASNGRDHDRLLARVRPYFEVQP